MPSSNWCGLVVARRLLCPIRQTNGNAQLVREEDLSPLHEVSMKTAGVSHLEMCIYCGIFDEERGYEFQALTFVEACTLTDNIE